MVNVEIISFGYGHGPAPNAHATFDVQDHFSDPDRVHGMRHRTADDIDIRDIVMGTAGIPELIDAIVGAAHAFLRGPRPRPLVVGVGCRGGRHRSVAIVCEAAHQLVGAGVDVTVTHRDIAKPVIQRAAKD